MDGSSFWDGFTGLADKFAQPLVDKYVLGGGNATYDEGKMIDERLRFNNLNGSGPNDEQGARSSPKGLWDFLTGPSGRGSNMGGGMGFMLPALAVGGLILWLVLRRR